MVSAQVKKNELHFFNVMNYTFFPACGQEKLRTRVWNGRKVLNNRYPWAVYLRLADRAYCNGALINDRYVMTDVRCVPDNYAPEDVTAILGLSELKDTQIQSWAGTEKLQVESIIKQGGEKIANAHQHEIALLKLKHPVQIENGEWNPICLPNFSNYSNLFFTGYGKISNGGKLDHATGLHEADLEEVTDDRCKPFGNHWDKHKMCVESSTQAACAGDVGAALATRHKGHVYQVGVLVKPSQCGIAERGLSVYDRVFDYLDWIAENTEDAKWCAAPDDITKPVKTMQDLQNSNNRFHWSVSEQPGKPVFTLKVVKRDQDQLGLIMNTNSMLTELNVTLNATALLKA